MHEHAGETFSAGVHLALLVPRSAMVCSRDRGGSVSETQNAQLSRDYAADVWVIIGSGNLEI